MASLLERQSMRWSSCSLHLWMSTSAECWAFSVVTRDSLRKTKSLISCHFEINADIYGFDYGKIVTAASIKTRYKSMGYTEQNSMDLLKPSWLNMCQASCVTNRQPESHSQDLSPQTERTLIENKTHEFCFSSGYRD